MRSPALRLGSLLAVFFALLGQASSRKLTAQVSGTDVAVASSANDFVNALVNPAVTELRVVAGIRLSDASFAGFPSFIVVGLLVLVTAARHRRKGCNRG